MAAIALVLAGSALGSAAGAAVGGTLGFAAGSAALGLTTALGQAAGGIAGSLLAQSGQTSQGPRLSERSVQVSSYGAAIAEVWGGGRLAGSVIWSTDLIETETTQSAGKGGPELTTYSYSVSCAVAICEGPIGGIRRIWADAKLVYDSREDADAATQAGSTAFAEFMTVHTGSETQMPDATIEAIEGAGQVEAYRGTAYVVFTGLPLGDYGNRVPNFSFEVTTEPAVEVELEDLIAPEIGIWADSPPAHLLGDVAAITEYFIDDGGPGVYEYTYGDAYATFVGFNSEAIYYLHYYTSYDDTPSVIDGAGVLDEPGEGPQYAYLVHGCDEPTVFSPGSIGLDAHLLNIGAAQNDNEIYYCPGMTVGFGGASDTGAYLFKLFRNDSGATLGNYTFGTSLTNYPPEIVGPDVFYPAVYYYRLKNFRAERKETFRPQACILGDPVALGIAQLPGNAAVCMSSTGQLTPNYTYTETAGTYKQLQAKGATSGYINKLPLGPVVRSTDPLATDSAYWTAAAAAAGVSGTYGVDFPVTVSTAGVGVAVADEREAGSIVLSQIVSDICVDAGLSTGQIDVTDLTDIVLGYQRTRVMSARAALEPLRQAYFFDAVESGDIIRFVKRGGTSIATLTLDDLGAGQESATEPIEHDRGQQTELPASVAVSYQSPTADYQVGVQQSRRRVGGSQQAVQVELPLVMQDLTAAQISDVLLYDAWASRTGRKISVIRAHAYIEPTDVITLDDGETAYRVRVVDKVEDGGVISLECRDDDASSYAPNSTAGVVSGGGSTLRFDGPSALYLLDIPILRDADDGVGYYAGATGYRDTWRGARAFRSADAGVNYSAVRDMTVRVAAGTADTALATYVGGNTVDELHTVDVTLLSGTLSSITRAQLLSGGNVAVLGSEVLQFQRATLVTGTTYRLSGLLRGRVGTEQHMGTHAAGERFVVISEGTTYRIAAPSSEIGQASVWKAVTLGDTLADAFAVNFTNTAIGAKPLAPVHLAAASVGGGNYSVQWVRRTRIDGVWRDLVDAQIGEATESYVVTVTRAGATISSTTVSTHTATVAALSGDVVTVAQLSAVIGPGFAASITLT